MTHFSENIILRKAQFPNTRYQGSKLKLVNWIGENVKFLDFENTGDIFGGTAAVSYMFKMKDKSVVYNDLLKFNYYTGAALIENSSELINYDDLNIVLSEQNDENYSLVQNIFKDVYFTDDENIFIDNYIYNLNSYFDHYSYKYAMLLWCLFQACIIKRPFNLFHRKNLYMRTNDVKRSFGNKVTWDKSFNWYIRKFTEELNQAIFDNGKQNISLNMDAMELDIDFDLVYIDTPYISINGSNVDYLHFYHFLEGLCGYEGWKDKIDFSKKHKPLKNIFNPWNYKDKISKAFVDLLNKYRKSHIVISYRSDGIPSIEFLVDTLKKLKKNVTVFSYGEYRYVLSQNGKSQEMLILGYD